MLELIESVRKELTGTYASDHGDADKRRHKAEVFARARDAHTSIASRYEISGGFTRWFADDLNNAKIGSVAAYNSEVPAFINMIEAHDFDFAAFFRYVDKLGALDKPDRDGCLAAWKQQGGRPGQVCPGLKLAKVTVSG